MDFTSLSPHVSQKTETPQSLLNSVYRFIESSSPAQRTASQFLQQVRDKLFSLHTSLNKLNPKQFKLLLSRYAELEYDCYYSARQPHSKELEREVRKRAHTFLRLMLYHSVLGGAGEKTGTALDTAVLEVLALVKFEYLDNSRFIATLIKKLLKQLGCYRKGRVLTVDTYLRDWLIGESQWPPNSTSDYGSDEEFDGETSTILPKRLNNNSKSPNALRSFTFEICKKSEQNFKYLNETPFVIDSSDSEDETVKNSNKKIKKNCPEPTVFINLNDDDDQVDQQYETEIPQKANKITNGTEIKVGSESKALVKTSFEPNKGQDNRKIEPDNFQLNDIELQKRQIVPESHIKHNQKVSVFVERCQINQSKPDNCQIADSYQMNQMVPNNCQINYIESQQCQIIKSEPEGCQIELEKEQNELIDTKINEIESDTCQVEQICSQVVEIEQQVCPGIKTEADNCEMEIEPYNCEMEPVETFKIEQNTCQIDRTDEGEFVSMCEVEDSRLVYDVKLNLTDYDDITPVKSDPLYNDDTVDDVLMFLSSKTVENTQFNFDLSLNNVNLVLPLHEENVHVEPDCEMKCVDPRLIFNKEISRNNNEEKVINYTSCLEDGAESLPEMNFAGGPMFSDISDGILDEMLFDNNLWMDDDEFRDFGDLECFLFDEGGCDARFFRVFDEILVESCQKKDELKENKTKVKRKKQKNQKVKKRKVKKKESLLKTTLINQFKNTINIKYY